MKRWQLAVVAVGLVLFGLVLGLGYSVVRHAGSDHLNHHVMIVVINELIRRDPSLAAVVDAALGVPDTVTAPPVEEAEPPADEPDSP